MVKDAEVVQRAGPGHPGFQDRGSTTGAITPAELQRLAETGGTLVINGEEVDVASLVRDNVAYGDNTDPPRTRRKAARGGLPTGPHDTGQPPYRRTGDRRGEPLRTGISRNRPGHHL